MYDDKQLEAVEEIALHAIDLRVLSEAKNLGPIKVTAFPAICITPKERGVSFTISKRPAKSHPLSTGPISCFGFISPWPWYSPVWRRTDVHIERARSYTVNDAHSLTLAMRLQANFWYD